MKHPKTEPREGPCPKVGLILESGGPDPRRSGPTSRSSPIWSGNCVQTSRWWCVPWAASFNLLPERGAVARLLLSVEGCVCVFVIWDLFPAWREGVSPACARTARQPWHLRAAV